jgi:hypothetical protein
MATLPQLRTQIGVHATRLRAGPLSAVDRNAMADDLDRIVVEMKRRPAVRRAPDETPPLTPSQKRDLIAFAAKHYNASYKSLAHRFKTTVGRVSEVLAGKRK